MTAVEVRHLNRSLRLFDSTMIVAGSMMNAAFKAFCCPRVISAKTPGRCLERNAFYAAA
jgi:hypothetical protein